MDPIPQPDYTTHRKSFRVQFYNIPNCAPFNISFSDMYRFIRRKICFQNADFRRPFQFMDVFVNSNNITFCHYIILYCIRFWNKFSQVTWLTAKCYNILHCTAGCEYFLTIFTFWTSHPDMLYTLQKWGKKTWLSQLPFKGNVILYDVIQYALNVYQKTYLSDKMRLKKLMPDKDFHLHTGGPCVQ
jgi:hypothetical protein